MAAPFQMGGWHRIIGLSAQQADDTFVGGGLEPIEPDELRAVLLRCLGSRA